MLSIYTYQTPVGPLSIVADARALLQIACPDRLQPEKEQLCWQESELTSLAAAQLAEYFAGRRRCFDLPLQPRGTSFQQRVWQVLRTIPYGETRSYRQVAELAGSPRGYRAVGMANHRNPLLIVIPCHRVIGADGSLTGFGGGMEMKRALLDLEQKGGDYHGIQML